MRKQIFYAIVSLFFIAVISSCNSSKDDDKKPNTYVQDNYTKKEVTIEMRDGIKLHTVIYSPKDQSKTYPILM
jgi:hypothetical protein